MKWGEAGILTSMQGEGDPEALVGTCACIVGSLHNLTSVMPQIFKVLHGISKRSFKKLQLNRKHINEV